MLRSFFYCYSGTGVTGFALTKLLLYRIILTE